MLLEKLFFNMTILFILLLFILSINNFIFSMIKVLSFVPITFVKIAPLIKPRNNTDITNMLIFLFGMIILLMLLYFLIIVSPIKIYS